MNDTRFEEAIREALRRRRVEPAPGRLRARVARVPDEVDPARRRIAGRAVRAGLAGAAIAAGLAGLVVAGERWPLDRAWLAGQAPGLGAFDPLQPGGLADVGWFGGPWVLGLWLVIGLGTVALGARRLAPWLFARLGAKTSDELPPQPVFFESPLEILSLVAAGLSLIAVIAFNAFVGHQPLSPGTAHGPGFGVGEVRADGRVSVVRHDGSWGVQPAPRYVYPIGPGEPYAVVISVRNDGPFPIRILGHQRTVQMVSGQPLGRTNVVGMAALRDLGRPTAELDNLEPFQPIDLAVSAEVSLAIVMVGTDCALGELPVVRQPDDEAWVSSPFAIVFDVLGWRRVTEIDPPFLIDEPEREDC